MLKLQRSSLQQQNSTANASWESATKSALSPVADEYYLPVRAPPSSLLLLKGIRTARMLKHQDQDDDDDDRALSPTKFPKERSSLKRATSESWPTSKLQQQQQRILMDENKMKRLLSLLRTNEFAGEIDPEYHSRFLTSPDDEEMGGITAIESLSGRRRPLHSTHHRRSVDCLRERKRQRQRTSYHLHGEVAMKKAKSSAAVVTHS